jgi:hypothetical protein
MKKSRFGDWQLQKAFPPHLPPETEADRTPRGSLLACMTANREPSNQSFEVDREATVCTASRRFLPLCGGNADQNRNRKESKGARYSPASL